MEMPAVSFGMNNMAADPLVANGARTFERLEEGCCRLTTADGQITLEASQLRRERHELVGDLMVRCALAGAPTVDGVLSAGTFNYSSPRARTERAGMLAKRAKTGDLVDWEALLEEACQRVLAAEREGDPSIDLRTVDASEDEELVDVLGLQIPARHQSILFADGGSCKTWLAEIIAGELVRLNYRVAYVDYELDRFVQSRRFRRLFGEIPEIAYVEAQRPLIHEVDRLKRIVREHRIDYAVIDSVAPACNGPAEAQESASEYYRATRQLGIGTLNIAHTTKNGENNDKRPFGSAFWHNAARSTWHVKRANDQDGDRVTLGLYNRKASLGPLQPAVGIELQFGPTGVGFVPVSVADVPGLASGLPLWERVKKTVTQGPKSIAMLAEELGAKEDSVRYAVKRNPAVFSIESNATGTGKVVWLKERRVH